MKQAIHKIRYQFSQLATSLGNGFLKEDDNTQLKAWIEEVKALQLPSPSDVPNTEEERLELLQLKISLQNVRTTRVLLMIFDMANAANKEQLQNLSKTLFKVIRETFVPLVDEALLIQNLTLKDNLVNSLKQTSASISDLLEGIRQKYNTNFAINNTLKEHLQKQLQAYSKHATDRMITDNLRAIFSNANNASVVPMSPITNDAIDILANLRNASSNNNNNDHDSDEDTSTQSTDIYSVSHSQDDDVNDVNANNSATSDCNFITGRTHAIRRPWCTLDGGNNQRSAEQMSNNNQNTHDNIDNSHIAYGPG